MERLDGTTMLEDFSKHPWRLFRYAAMLADLMKKLHVIEPPSWLNMSEVEKERMQQLVEENS